VFLLWIIKVNKIWYNKMIVKMILGIMMNNQEKIRNFKIVQVIQQIHKLLLYIMIINIMFK
jgi:hypothetical protein